MGSATELEVVQHRQGELGKRFSLKSHTSNDELVGGELVVTVHSAQVTVSLQNLLPKQFPDIQPNDLDKLVQLKKPELAASHQRPSPFQLKDFDTVALLCNCNVMSSFDMA